MAEIFDPQKAMASLRDWAIKLEEVGKRKITAMVEYNFAQIKLMEKEQEARKKIFEDKEDVQASKLRDWIKWICAEEELDAFRKECAYKEVRDEYDTIDRLISVTQTATKLAEAEMRNLGIN